MQGPGERGGIWVRICGKWLLNGELWPECGGPCSEGTRAQGLMLCGCLLEILIIFSLTLYSVYEA